MQLGWGVTQTTPMAQKQTQHKLSTHTQIQHKLSGDRAQVTDQRWSSSNRSAIGLREMGSQPARTAQLALAKTAQPAATRTESRLTRAPLWSASSPAKKRGDEGGASGKK